MDATVADRIAESLGGRKSSAAQQAVSGFRAQIDANDTSIAQWAQRITQARMRNREEHARLEIASQAANDSSYAEHLAEEWAKLREHDRLVNAEGLNDYDPGVLTLLTTDDIRLHAEDREDTRWLGAFRITLNLESGEIGLHNLNTRRGGRDHPHVINGKPCFGSDEAVFSELMTNGSLFMLYEMLLQYLEKLNLADQYGAYGAYWFDVDDVRPEGAPAPPPQPEVLNIYEFAQRHGEGAEFVCTDPASEHNGQHGRVTDPDGGEEDTHVEWLDGEGNDTAEGDWHRHLFVTLQAEMVTA